MNDTVPMTVDGHKALKEELARLAKDLESCEDVRAVVTNGAP